MTATLPTWLAATGFCIVATVACAADLGSGGQDPYAPVPPIGFASEFPRSPFEDILVNGFQRFRTPAEAQAHCPHDRVVAVPFLVPRYGAPDQGGVALYMCRTDAVAEGNRPSVGP